METGLQLPLSDLSVSQKPLQEFSQLTFLHLEVVSESAFHSLNDGCTH